MLIAPIPSQHLDQYQRGYPRPQLRREEWYSLNGSWEFALDVEGMWQSAADVTWSGHIRVPFAPESPLSGIGHTGFFRACWYRYRCELPPRGETERWMLHFGAVDWHATVWVNGICAGEHTGGYVPFSFDITNLVTSPTCEIIVRAEDDPHDLAKPRGKQDWQLEPHSIWYPRTSGIWQTVWVEKVPATRVGRICFTPSLARWEIGVEVWLEGERRQDLRLGVRLRSRDTVLAADTYLFVSGEVHRGVALSDPGIDDSRNDLLWSPQAPNLIDVELEVWGHRGELIDRVQSYTALRAATAQGDRFLLNGRPYLLRMVLDQGYWSDGGLTAPNDAALRRDVELAREMGFNGVRKHQKIEDPRYLYWADRIGLAVWEEMPSAYRFTRLSIDRLSREWASVIQRDYSHPCIVAWVPINESWGVPNLPDNPRERHYVQALYHLTKTLDATRPVIGNDGWESVATDIISIHDYDDQPPRIATRYHAEAVLPRLFKRERPGGRLLVLEGQSHVDLPLMLTEFGGMALARGVPGVWGYSSCTTPEEFARAYTKLLEVVRNLSLLAGFCYTQFSDTYQEANGLLYADRTPKFPIRQIAGATAGRTVPHEGGLEQLQTVIDGSEVR
ncbi:MAG TPA: glycoside hydrolase family 2 TIM barrel-domain containing protein [Vicinamibacterales bacterium]|nr:glycoside hydrolase family 2 TIM barrel-domain containing protein [Vicinamibacterales bacterium]